MWADWLAATFVVPGEPLVPGCLEWYYDKFGVMHIISHPSPVETEETGVQA